MNTDDYLSRSVESFVERAHGDKTLASVGFRSSTATYIICNLITPAYLSISALLAQGLHSWCNPAQLKLFEKGYPFWRLISGQRGHHIQPNPLL